jgi:hypothetical protein
VSARRDDRRAALAADATEWAREEQRGEESETRERLERLDALLIRARDAGLSDGEIAEMLNGAVAEAKSEDAEHDALTPGSGLTEQDVLEAMRDVFTERDVRQLMRDQEGDEGHGVGEGPSAIWGGATLGLVVGLILPSAAVTGEPCYSPS